FWETEPSNWNNIVSKSWTKAKVITSNGCISLQLKPYKYKSVRAIDFYIEAKKQLDKHPHFQSITETVSSIQAQKNPIVTTENNSYSGSHVFDSRIPESFYKKSRKHITLTRHSKGWTIKTEKDFFDEETFTMMDLRLKAGEQTTFTYVL